MIRFFIILICLLGLSFSSYKKRDKYSSLIEKVKNINDSISVGNMTIHNAFKHQILAHTGGNFDSLRILKKVYEPNKYVFDNCLGVIFGNENGKMFKPDGIFEWNKNLLNNYESLISEKLSIIDSIDINDLFNKHLTAVQEITHQKGNGKWLVYFGPKDFQIFGGCDNSSMILDMFGDNWNTKDINAVFAHEIEHLIYSPILENDKNANTGLGITIDEGLAQFFTYKYLNLSVNDALFGQQTPLLLNKEKEIFKKLEPYFYKTNTEGCPIFKHCGRSNNCENIITDLPDNLSENICYFLGFRIIQKYEENNGKDSWKDIYKIPINNFYLKSGYKKFIESKK